MSAYIIYFFIVLCLVSSKKYEYEDYSSEEYSDVEPEFIHVETTLDLRGNVRKFFVLEMGLNARDNQNVICSSLAAMMPLAKLLIGAKKRSGTETEILHALGLKSRGEVKYVYKQLIRDIETLEGVEIALASRLYISKRKRLKQAFVRKSQSIFRSAIELINTNRPEEVADEINDWMYENTRHKILKAVSRREIDTADSLILVNCIYFKGRWAEPFKGSHNHVFYTPSRTKIATMMSTDGIYNYYQSSELNSQIIEIPYVGHKSAMIIVLPDSREGLRILLRTLQIAPELLNEALMKMKSAVVSITIPEFRIETRVDIRHYYKKMGISKILHREHSDLDGIVKDEILHIANGIHQAVIEVDEEGTEAAAFIALSGPKLPSQDSLRFIANHPFLFYIRADHEQLFAGVVNDP